MSSMTAQVVNLPDPAPSLRALIRAELDSAPTPINFADVAACVLAQVEDPLAELRSVMHLVISDVIRNQRGRIPAPSEFTRPEPTEPTEPSAHPKFDRRAARVAAVEADLQQMYHTADGQKRLAELTADELAYVVDTLRDKARANLAKADQLDALRAEMVRRGVATVQELLA